ncbi:hypothetical protein [uncultured Desulfobulbus sp.]|uniref:hypothetical protein n=1 Tax=uncultured Desulfobulbus sp. TaxID=239745 RepID=UPI0029C79141|nr:hypothetical protein [uncultured Desulfobulbus sp.]
MNTAQFLQSNKASDDAIDIIDALEESLEISIADIVLNRVFIERHFSHYGLYVHGNKKEFLLILRYLIFNSIEAMKGLALKVLKIRSQTNQDATKIFISFRTSNCTSEHLGLNKSNRCVPSKKNGYCQWLEITENIIA